MESHFIFTYGTLQEKNIQKQLLKRELIGNRDVAKNFSLDTIQLPKNSNEAKTYFIAIFTGATADAISGTVYQITKKELILLDDYEGSEYKRSQIILQSGKRAFIYHK